MELTTRQYASRRSISMQAVTKAIRDNHALPCVKKIKRINQHYLLVIDKVNFEKLYPEKQ